LKLASLLFVVKVFLMKNVFI